MSGLSFPTSRHADLLVPGPEIDRRLDALRARLTADDLGWAWIDHFADRLYFSGSPQDGALIVPAEGDPVFFVRKSRQRAEVEAHVETRAYPGRKALGGILREMSGGHTRRGLVMDVSSAATLRWLEQTSSPGDVADITRHVRTLRAVKSPWELEQIRVAALQASTLFSEVPEAIRPGMTELALTGHVEGRLRELGHGGTVRVRRPGVDITMGVVVAGDSAFYPTSFPGPVGAEGPYPASAASAGTRTIAAGDSVMIDIVTAHNGYHADTTRAYFVGDDIPERARTGHDFCREILAQIERRLRPGAICSEIFRQVTDIAGDMGEPEGFMGYGENRVRFLGHGVGLELDELPVLAEKIDMPVEIGTVMAVEPKAFLSGIGPVGVENTYVVHADGCESLCAVDDTLRPV